MSPDMKLLVWSAVLCFAQMMVAQTGAYLQVGLPTLAGNRDDMPPLRDWAGRARRAHANMLENLLLFAILVLAAQAMGRANAATALGAQLFFWARLVYAGVYVAGVAWVRTAAWFVAVIGLAIIFLQLV